MDATASLREIGAATLYLQDTLARSLELDATTRDVFTRELAVIATKVAAAKHNIEQAA
jgi:hypothetical protein